MTEPRFPAASRMKIWHARTDLLERVEGCENADERDLMGSGGGALRRDAFGQSDDDVPEIADEHRNEVIADRRRFK